MEGRLKDGIRISRLREGFEERIRTLKLMTPQRRSQFLREEVTRGGNDFKINGTSRRESGSQGWKHHGERIKASVTKDPPGRSQDFKDKKCLEKESGLKKQRQLKERVGTSKANVR